MRFRWSLVVALLGLLAITSASASSANVHSREIWVRSHLDGVRTTGAGYCRDYCHAGFAPHLSPKPRLQVHRGATVTIAFRAPAADVEVTLQRPNKSGSDTVNVAYRRAHRISDRGLRWRAQLPRRPHRADGLEIDVGYPHGQGIYWAGLRFVR